jgi:hypothetical protein
MASHEVVINVSWRLCSEGLSTIIDAMVESRRTFRRLHSYTLYACTTTVGIVLRFSVLVWAYGRVLQSSPVQPARMYLRVMTTCGFKGASHSYKVVLRMRVTFQWASSLLGYNQAV